MTQSFGEPFYLFITTILEIYAYSWSRIAHVMINELLLYAGSGVRNVGISLKSSESYYWADRGEVGTDGTCWTLPRVQRASPNTWPGD